MGSHRTGCGQPNGVRGPCGRGHRRWPRGGRV